MKNIISYTILVTLTIFISCGNKQNTNTNQHSMSVNVALPEVDSVTLQKSYPGTLSAQSEVNLVARVNGFLQQANYKPGDIVNKGQVIFVIEPKPYQEAVAQAQAQLSSAKSQNEYARTNYESMKEAAKTNAVSQIDFVQADTKTASRSANLPLRA